MLLQSNKLARPLCAAMKRMTLILAMVLCFVGTWGVVANAAENEGELPVLPFSPVAPTLTDTDAAVAEGDARYTAYRYVVNVEFGSMSFYYDWGRWNVDELTYVSDSTSRSPAAATSDGAPGWYGFDGAANRIGLNYRRIGNEAGTEYLKVTVQFNFATDGVGTPLFATDRMALWLYDTSDFTGPLARMEASNAYSTNLIVLPSVDDVSTPTIDEAEIMQDYYLSLEGAPYRADLTAYKNGTPTSLGLLTIRIDFAS